MMEDNLICANCGDPQSNHSTFWDDAHTTQLTCCTGKEYACKCTKFVAINPELPRYLQDIDSYMAKFEHIAERMKWVLENLKWFRNYSDKFVPFAWWYHINHWDCWHEPLTPTIFSKLDAADAITRARRIWREYDRKHNTNMYLEFEPTITEQKQFKQLAIEEFVTQHGAIEARMPALNVGNQRWN